MKQVLITKEPLFLALITSHISGCLFLCLSVCLFFFWAVSLLNLILSVDRMFPYDNIIELSLFYMFKFTLSPKVYLQSLFTFPSQQVVTFSS